MIKRKLAFIAVATLAAVPFLRSANAETMPKEIETFASKIGLEEAEWHPFGKQPDLEGNLSGTWVEIDFRHGSEFEEIEAEHHGLFPAKAIEAVVPEVLKNSADYPSDAQFNKLKLDANEYEIEGRTAKGEWFEAEFDGRGHLLKWEDK